MRTAIGLIILAAGAILTFAVSAHVPGINLRIAGLIIILTGLAELITPARAAHWLRRRGQAGDMPSDPAVLEPEEVAYPAYLLQDPAVLAAEVLNGARAGQHGNDSRPGPQRTVRAAGQRPGPHRIEDAGDWES
jgi:hypothetical protein